MFTLFYTFPFSFPVPFPSATIVAAGASAALGAIVALAVVVYISRRGKTDDGANVHDANGMMVPPNKLEHWATSIQENGKACAGPTDEEPQSKLVTVATDELTRRQDAVTGGRLSRNTSAGTASEVSKLKYSDTTILCYCTAVTLLPPHMQTVFHMHHCQSHVSS